MKRFAVLLFVLLVASAASFASGSVEKSGSVSLTGYLIDKHCFGLKAPSDETVMCLNMEMCKATGYGIAVEQSDGTFRFFKFDTDGHNKAQSIVAAASGDKLGKITVTGKIDGENFIVKTIEIAR
jgi:type 1 fimbria pilin